MRTLTPWGRKFVLAVHITVSVGWVGAVAAYIPLDIIVATIPDVSTSRAGYIAMDVIARWAIVPLAVASFLTGLVISIGTKWGLFRHYWTVISLVLTVLALVVLLVETRTIGAFADVAANPAASDDDVRALGSTLVHSIGGMVVLLVITVLNVYKPRGLTRYGRRKRPEERGASEAA